jgi:putative flippase GtrA
MIYVQYIKFFINGGILGLIAIVMQSTIYGLIDKNSEFAYGFASAATYILLIAINFLIQKNYIFKRNGLLVRFVFANLIIMLLVSLLAMIMKDQLNMIFGYPWGNRAGFILAALIGSIPSFLLKRIWVFNSNQGLLPKA